MTLDALIRLVDKFYPDGGVLNHWDPEHNRPRVHTGSSNDTLALFIVRELKDTFDKDAEDKEQLRIALRAMKMAEKEVGKVVAGLEAAHHKARSKVIPFPKKTKT